MTDSEARGRKRGLFRRSRSDIPEGTPSPAGFGDAPSWDDPDDEMWDQVEPAASRRRTPRRGQRFESPPAAAWEDEWEEEGWATPQPRSIPTPDLSPGDVDAWLASDADEFADATRTSAERWADRDYMHDQRGLAAPAPGSSWPDEDFDTPTEVIPPRTAQPPQPPAPAPAAPTLRFEPQPPPQPPRAEPRVAAEPPTYQQQPTLQLGPDLTPTTQGAAPARPATGSTPESVSHVWDDDEAASWEDLDASPAPGAEGRQPQMRISVPGEESFAPPLAYREPPTEPLTRRADDFQPSFADPEADLDDAFGPDDDLFDDLDEDAPAIDTYQPSTTEALADDEAYETFEGADETTYDEPYADAETDDGWGDDDYGADQGYDDETQLDDRRPRDRELVGAAYGSSASMQLTPGWSRWLTSTGTFVAAVAVIWELLAIASGAASTSARNLLDIAHRVGRGFDSLGPAHGLALIVALGLTMLPRLLSRGNTNTNTDTSTAGTTIGICLMGALIAVVGSLLAFRYNWEVTKIRDRTRASDWLRMLANLAGTGGLALAAFAGSLMALREHEQ